MAGPEPAFTDRSFLRSLRWLQIGVSPMTAPDIGLLAAQLVSCWCAGFAAGFTLTRFREALNQIP